MRNATMIDMGISNLGSVAAAFERIGAEVTITSDPAQVAGAELLVLPGVGAFPDGMAALRERGLVEPVRRHALERGRPLLGICLGMQLLTAGSDEHGGAEGLGLVPGRSVALRPDDTSLRVPNIGWSDVQPAKAGTLFADETEDSFYFAHSFHVQCEDESDVAATIDYGGTVTAAVERGRIAGVQFHPEKSQDAGLSVLAAFLEAA